MELLSPKQLHRIGPVALIVLGAAALFITRLCSEGLPEIADGVFHFQYAKYSWKHPEHLVDHWAKPMFTLLSSPFAQLGLEGMALFNAVLAAATALMIAWAMRQRGRSLAWFIPALLFMAPQYTHTVLNGMTEVLFGAMTIAILLSAMKGRTTMAAILTSFLPFVRPEFPAILPIVTVWMIVVGQWRKLPWLLAGNLIYALGGWVILGDPFWWYNQDQYAGVDIYGTGDKWHFWDHIDDITGKPLRIAYLTALLLGPALLFLERSKWQSNLLIIVMAGIPPIVIWAMHSYVWWKGGYASLGLLRVLATGIPLAVLFTIYVLGGVWLSISQGKVIGNFLGALLLILISVWSWKDLHDRQELPMPTSQLQRVLDRAAECIAQHQVPSHRLIYLFPYLGAKVGVDPWDKNEATVVYFLQHDEPARGIDHGDLVAWDAQLCPNEGNLPLEELLYGGDFELLEVITPQTELRTFHNQMFEIWLFRRRSVSTIGRTEMLRLAPHSYGRFSRLDLLSTADSTSTCLTEVEYPLELIDVLHAPPGTQWSEVEFRSNARTKYGASFPKLVYTEQKGDQELRREIIPEVDGRSQTTLRIPLRQKSVEDKLVLWNPGQQPVCLDSLIITLKHCKHVAKNEAF